MENEQLITHLLDKFKDKVQKLDLSPAQAAVVVDVSALREFCTHIRDEESVKLDYLSSISAVDYLEEGMEVVYHFYSIGHGHGLTLKVKLNREKPEIPSIIDIYPSANWYEREIWELYGIDVQNHPDLKTFLLPEDWDQGWPMRRDWEGGEDFVRMPEF